MEWGIRSSTTATIPVSYTPSARRRIPTMFYFTAPVKRRRPIPVTTHRLEFGRIAELDAESIGIFHMEGLRALFVRLRSNAAGLQVSDYRIVIEFINSQAEVVNVPGGL